MTIVPRSWRCFLFLLLATVLVPHPTAAFASYMLARSGCSIDLDTSEVIMNSLVQAAAESDDPGMRIHVVDRPVSASHQYSVSELPTSIHLEMTSPRGSFDFQFVLQVVDDEEGTNAHFAKGGCDNKQRIAGRPGESVELVIENVPVRVVGGWAAGHERVRLTPETVIDMEADESGESDLGSNEKLGDKNSEVVQWFDSLVAPEGCIGIDMLDVDVLAESDVLDRDWFRLDAQQVSDSHGPADDVRWKMQLTAKTDSSPTGKPATVVFEAKSSSSSVAWEHESTSCNGQRVVVTRAGDATWPNLVIPAGTSEPVVVTALYTLEDSVSEIYRVPRVNWTPDSSAEKSQGKSERKTDPQKAHDEKLLAMNDFQAQAESAKRRQKAQTGERVATIHTHADDDTIPERPRRAKALEDYALSPEDVFSIRGYFVGLVVFLSTTVASTTCCLVTSRRASKGRRDL